MAAREAGIRGGSEKSQLRLEALGRVLGNPSLIIAQLIRQKFFVLLWALWGPESHGGA